MDLLQALKLEDRIKAIFKNFFLVNLIYRMVAFKYIL